MNQEKINAIRKYYQLSEDVTDEDISNQLEDSWGSYFFDIRSAKMDLYKSISNLPIVKILYRNKVLK